jgi:hypothetical protein
MDGKVARKVVFNVALKVTKNVVRQVADSVV